MSVPSGVLMKGMLVSRNWLRLRRSDEGAGITQFNYNAAGMPIEPWIHDFGLTGRRWRHEAYVLRIHNRLPKITHRKGRTMPNILKAVLHTLAAVLTIGVLVPSPPALAQTSAVTS